MRAVWSSLAVTMVLPSGLYAAELTAVAVAGELAQLLAGGGIPDAGGLVATGGDDSLPSGLYAAE